MPGRLWLTFNENEKIRCHAHTIVVKMKSLREHYPGGPDAYIRRHQTICNRDLAMVWSTNEYDHHKSGEELESYGIKAKVDFARIDTFSQSMRYLVGKKTGFNQQKLNEILDLGIDWLEADIREDGYWVSYRDD